MKQGPWKRKQRELPIEYPTQPQLLFKPREATPEEFDQWQETELKWWADQQFKIVIIATIVQFTCLAFMFSVMALNSYLF